MRFRFTRNGVCLVWLCCLLFAGCSLPVAGATSTMDSTQAYQTVNARLTEIISRTPVTPTKAVPSTETSAPQTSASPSATLLLISSTPSPIPASPTVTATQVCDRAAAGSPIDVSVPDDTRFNPGDPFTKIWRLVNIGNCTWSKQYAARFFYGAQMDAPSAVFLSQEVRPGEALEIAVDMLAPQEPGVYQSNWKLSNAAGQLFGIGPNGDAPFWVRIIVIEPPTVTPSPTTSATPSSTPTDTATPEPTATATPVIQIAGTASLTINNQIDLDNGQIGSEEGDLAFLNQEGSTFHVLAPQADAQFGIFGSTEPGLENCQNASKSTAPIVLESLTAGIYLCYQTDQGRFGQFQYDEYISDTVTINITYNTWALP
jgi:hypothetical protein